MATYDLFISYADADRTWVEGYLLDALTQAGVRCHTEAAFELGRPRLLEFERAVQQSRRTLLVLSPAYLAGEWNSFVQILSMSYGIENQTWPVIPLLLQPVDIPPSLSMLVAIDATDASRWDDCLERLRRALLAPAITPSPNITCPYPGMAPFGEQDYEQFFGRKREVRELVTRLRRHHFQAIIGPSGSGKSSLVFAGLIPALHQSGQFGAGSWLIVKLRPGEAPIAALKDALGGDPADLSQAVEQALERARSPEHDPQRLLVIVDQFEELFTTARADEQLFQETCLQLAQLPNCYVILTVRSDFYSQLFASPLWNEIRAHRFEVTQLRDDELREAIRLPAEKVGVFVADALIERLVADANIRNEPGVLPLVQESLLRLWDMRARRLIPLQAYLQLGDGERSGLDVAMARHADDVLAALPEGADRAMAQQIFINLIQPVNIQPADRPNGRDMRWDVRRQQSVTRLRNSTMQPTVFDATLRRLTEERLLVISGDEDSPDRAVDIAHEKLIECWPQLREWIDAQREALQIKRRLEDKAAEWVRLGSQRGGLLDAIELGEVERWLGSDEALALGIGPELYAFARASREALDAEQVERRLQTRIRVALIAFSSCILIALAAAGWMYASGFGPFERPGSWVRLPDLGTESDIIVTSRQLHTLLVGTRNRGIVKLSDDGQRWVSVLSYEQAQGAIQSIAVAPDGSGAIYTGIKGGRLLYSPDGGTSWLDRGKVLDAAEINDLYIDPLDAVTVYAANAPRPYLYRSSDLGASWVTRTITLAPQRLSTITVAQAGADAVLYAATVSGTLLASYDRGESWRTEHQLHAPCGVGQIKVSPNDRALLDVACSDGLYHIRQQQGRLVAERLFPETGTFFVVTLAVDRALPQIIFAGGLNDVVMIRDTGSAVNHRTLAPLEGANVVRWLEAGDHQPYVLYAATDNGIFAWIPSLQERGWLGSE